MNVLCVIPARGGSKGIPFKNLRTILGTPLLAYAIRAARGSRAVTRVVVSTDDVQIASLAEAEGADVVKRPAEISGDEASSESALLHTLGELASEEGYQPELVVFMQCTSPLTLPEDIDAAVDRLVQYNGDCVFTAVPFHGFVWRHSAGGEAAAVNHDKATRPRRQDREPEYLENGAVYVMKTAGFLKHRHRFFGKILISGMPVERALDIDEPADLKRAEQLLNSRGRSCWHDRLAACSVRALVMDFDGVLTDNCVTVDGAGTESVVCNRGDGMGLSRLREFPVQVAVISTERNPVVSARCEKLGIECFQAVDDKVSLLQEWCRKSGLQVGEVVYVGNDINDLGCMQLAGIAAAPSDAHSSVLLASTIRLQTRGGMGAVREVCDELIAYFETRQAQEELKQGS